MTTLITAAKETILLKIRSSEKRLLKVSSADSKTDSNVRITLEESLISSTSEKFHVTIDHL